MKQLFQRKGAALYILLLIAVLILASPTSADPAGTLTIPFDGEMNIILERLENSEAALVLSFLYVDGKADPENICEFEDNSLPAEETVSLSACDAVRVVYTYAPSPIPEDAAIIFSGISYGTAEFEFIFAQDQPTGKANPSRFYQYHTDFDLSADFFGSEGGRIYNELPDWPRQFIQPIAGTRDTLHLFTKAPLVAWNHFEIPLLTDRQYVHQDFTPADNAATFGHAFDRFSVGFTVLLNGKVDTGGVAAPESAETESFEGPINSYTTLLSFNNPRIEGNRQIYRMTLVPQNPPVLRVAFTTDKKNVYYWMSESNARYRFQINYPGMEAVEPLLESMDPFFDVYNR